MNLKWTTLQDGVLHPGDDGYEDVMESQAVLDWIADGCPPVEGFKDVSEEDRAILLARPLTVAQAARREAVSDRTIYRWITSGELEAHRAGRGWRIDPDALDRRRVEASKPKPKATGPTRKRRTRKKPATASDATWWPS